MSRWVVTKMLLRTYYIHLQCKSTMKSVQEEVTSTLPSTSASYTPLKQWHSRTKPNGASRRWQCRWPPARLQCVITHKTAIWKYSRVSIIDLRLSNIPLYMICCTIRILNYCITSQLDIYTINYATTMFMCLQFKYLCVYNVCCLNFMCVLIVSYMNALSLVATSFSKSSHFFINMSNEKWKKSFLWSKSWKC